MAQAFWLIMVRWLTTLFLKWGLIINVAYTICASVITAIITSFLLDKIKRFGKLKIYCKLAKCKINNKNQSFSIQFPLNVFIEIQNTTNQSLVIRDFNGLLIRDKKVVALLAQGTHSNINKNNITKTEFHGNNGSYSFVANPKSINKYELYFICLHQNVQADELVFRYFNEKDKEIYLHCCYIDPDNENNKRVIQPQYVFLKRIKKNERPTNINDYDLENS